VAVEKRIVNVGGKQRTIRVPIDLTDGLAERDQMNVPRGGAAAKISYFGSARHPAAVSPGAPGGAPSAGVQLTAGIPATGATRLAGGSHASKIAESLSKAVGKVDVQIRLKDLSPATLKKLKDLGFRLDAKLEDLKVVVGQVDAKQLEPLAALAEVLAINPDSK
jgi:Ca-activated chloride channel family protein